MEVTVTLDTSAFDHSLVDLQRALTYASPLDLDNVAFKIRWEEHSGLGWVFMSPTKLIPNFVLVEKATKHSNVDKIYISDPTTKGTEPSKYLVLTIIGFSRNEKRF
ncbi:hypothetical protein [Microbulbifer variabilis]|uniref:hypothetical protein n=1 Tax=Microbulbifer variabilis TaxID=266805 RepID=UPI00036578F0|nr:hypothetical protein [Microbulbifer variabilis]